jgi:hypothetical protein
MNLHKKLNEKEVEREGSKRAVEINSIKLKLSRQGGEFLMKVVKEKFLKSQEGENSPKIFNVHSLLS